MHTNIKTFWVTVLILCTLNVMTQTTNNLDSQGGFKEFHLNDKQSKWTGEITKQINGSPFYEYTGTCCQTIFGLTVDKIGLQFTSDSLLSLILISTKNMMQGNELTPLINSLKSEFGSPYAVTPEANSDMTYQWVGEKVVLTVVFKYYGADKGGWQGTFMFVREEDTLNVEKDY